MAAQTIEDFLEDIRNCRDWQICKIPAHGVPLVDGSNSARVLLFSQAPSKKAWEARAMFKTANLTYSRFIEFFAVDKKTFDPANFVWIQAGNCYPGKHQNSSGDKKPNRHCSEKFLPPLAPLLNQFRLIVVGGGVPAQRWAEQFSLCGWSPNEQLEKVLERQCKGARFSTRRVDTVVIYNPSEQSRLGRRKWKPCIAKACEKLVREKITTALTSKAE